MEQEFVYGVNLSKVSASEEYGALVRLTAANLQTTAYLTLGSFIKSLTDSDLSHLMLQIESFNNISSFNDLENCQSAINDVMILGEMLAQAEGSPSQTAFDASKNFQYFVMVLTCEALARKGMVEIDYDLLSFDTDVRDDDFVRLKGL